MRIPRYKDTLLATKLDTEEIRKADLELLKKIDAVSSGAASTISDLDIATIVTDQYGRYRQYPDGSTQGRYVINGTTFTNRIAASSGVPLDIGSIQLPVGKWHIEAAIGLRPSNAATSVTMYQGAISLTSATLPANDTIGMPMNGEARSVLSLPASVPGTASTTIYVSGGVVEITTETTFYGVAQAAFTVSTLDAYGSIWATSVV